MNVNLKTACPLSYCIFYGTHSALCRLSPDHCSTCPLLSLPSGNPPCIPCLKGIELEGFQELFQLECYEILHDWCQINFRKLQFKNDYKCGGLCFFFFFFCLRKSFKCPWNCRIKYKLFILAFKDFLNLITNWFFRFIYSSSPHDPCEHIRPNTVSFGPLLK